MVSFKDFDLPEVILENLTRNGLIEPTPIQQQTIPLAMQGSDILATSNTGTGKTAAYLVPLIVRCLANPDLNALILAPTRELAVQIDVFLKKIVDRKLLRTALLIGGEPIGKQLSHLLTRPRIIIGTPGRIIDHLERESLKLNHCGFMVLDETDRMLDLGFGQQLNYLLNFLPKERQTLMFSATMPAAIKTLTQQYLNKSVQTVKVGQTNQIVETIVQKVHFIKANDKFNFLLEQIASLQGSIIVFVKTKVMTEEVADQLNDKGLEAIALHGDLRQRNRDRVLQQFRNEKKSILVATDIAARGLDIRHVGNIINHDLPQSEEDFIHRVGRTGRAGSDGIAITFITSQDSIKWRRICKMMNIPDEFFAKLADSSARKSSSQSPSRGRSGARSDSPFSRSGARSDSSFSKPRSDSPFSKPRGDSPYGKTSRGDAPRGGARADSPFSKPRGDSPYNKTSRGDAPFRSGARADSPFSKPRGDSPYSKTSRGDEAVRGGARADSPFNKPRGDAPYNGPRSDKAGFGGRNKSSAGFEGNKNYSSSNKTGFTSDRKITPKKKGFFS